LSVYDNNHCGNHLDITSNFDITPPDVQDKVELRTKHQLETLCWIHKEDDIVLVTAGAKGNIHVLSLADSREIRTIKAHDSKKSIQCFFFILYSNFCLLELIYDLQSHHQHDNLILSTSKDKTVKLWDINDGTCVAVYNTDATICVSTQCIVLKYELCLITISSAFILQAKNSLQVTLEVKFDYGILSK
jgi:WD40 repeat protein